MSAKASAPIVLELTVRARRGKASYALTRPGGLPARSTKARLLRIEGEDIDHLLLKAGFCVQSVVAAVETDGQGDAAFIARLTELAITCRPS